VPSVLRIIGRIGASLTVALIALGMLSYAPRAHAADYSDMVIDVNSGAVLHQTNADAPRFPASLTKMMTLYVVFDMLEKHRLTLDTKLTISDYAAAAQPSKLGLQPGDTISVDDGIKAIVTASANDVARALAENLGGDEDRFAAYMTWQAKKLGMTNTVFRNASGLPDPEQMTTARDYVTLSLRLYDDFPQYFKVFKTPYFAWGRARYRNHNGLLATFQGSDGIKTGYTRISGFNLAASVHRNGKHVIGVIFGGRTAGDRNSRMRALLTAALARSSTALTRVPARVALAAKAALKVSSQGAGTGKVAETTKPAKDAIGALIARNAAPTPASEPAIPAEPENDAAAGGPFNVQIGAYPTEAEAKHKLEAILGSAKDVLGRHAAVAVLYNGPKQVWYRARFAGFERPEADQTCVALRDKHIDCIVMRAD